MPKTFAGPLQCSLLGATFFLAAAIAAPASAGSDLGVYFPGFQQFKVAGALGVDTLRMQVQTTGPTRDITLSYARQAQTAGYRLLITYVNSCNGEQCAITNDALWQAQFGRAVNAVKPAMAVIGNEENNPDQPFNIHQYERQLTDAIPVAHAAGVAITNGGLTSLGVTLAYWHHLWTSGARTAADAFAVIAFAPGVTPAGNLVAYLPNTAHPNRPIPPQIIGPGRILPNTENLLAFYPGTGQDAVNLHFYNLPTALVVQVVAWVRQTTGLPVTCNEMGVSTGTPAPVTGEAMGGIVAGLSDIVWFGPDGYGPGHAVGLANPNGTLRPGGHAYAAVVKAHP